MAEKTSATSPQLEDTVNVTRDEPLLRSRTKVKKYRDVRSATISPFRREKANTNDTQRNLDGPVTDKTSLPSLREYETLQRLTKSRSGRHIKSSLPGIPVQVRRKHSDNSAENKILLTAEENPNKPSTITRRYSETSITNSPKQYSSTDVRNNGLSANTKRSEPNRDLSLSVQYVLEVTNNMVQSARKNSIRPRRSLSNLSSDEQLAESSNNTLLNVQEMLTGRSVTEANDCLVENITTVAEEGVLKDAGLNEIVQYQIKKSGTDPSKLLQHLTDKVAKHSSLKSCSNATRHKISTDLKQRLQGMLDGTVHMGNDELQWFLQRLENSDRLIFSALFGVDISGLTKTESATAGIERLRMSNSYYDSDDSDDSEASSSVQTATPPADKEQMMSAIPKPNVKSQPSSQGSGSHSRSAYSDSETLREDESDDTEDDGNVEGAFGSRNSVRNESRTQNKSRTKTRRKKKLKSHRGYKNYGRARAKQDHDSGSSRSHESPEHSRTNLNLNEDVSLSPLKPKRGYPKRQGLKIAVASSYKPFERCNSKSKRGSKTSNTVRENSNRRRNKRTYLLNQQNSTSSVDSQENLNYNHDRKIVRHRRTSRTSLDSNTSSNCNASPRGNPVNKHSSSSSLASASKENSSSSSSGPLPRPQADRIKGNNSIKLLDSKTIQTKQRNSKSPENRNGSKSALDLQASKPNQHHTKSSRGSRTPRSKPKFNSPRKYSSHRSLGSKSNTPRNEHTTPGYTLSSTSLEAEKGFSPRLNMYWQKKLFTNRTRRGFNRFARSKHRSTAKTNLKINIYQIKRKDSRYKHGSKSSNGSPVKIKTPRKRCVYKRLSTPEPKANLYHSKCSCDDLTDGLESPRVSKASSKSLITEKNKSTDPKQNKGQITSKENTGNTAKDLPKTSKSRSDVTTDSSLKPDAVRSDQGKTIQIRKSAGRRSVSRSNEPTQPPPLAQPNSKESSDKKQDQPQVGGRKTTDSLSSVPSKELKARENEPLKTRENEPLKTRENYPLKTREIEPPKDKVESVEDNKQNFMEQLSQTYEDTMNKAHEYAMKRLKFLPLHKKVMMARTLDFHSFEQNQELATKVGLNSQNIIVDLKSKDKQTVPKSATGQTQLPQLSSQDQNLNRSKQSIKVPYKYEDTVQWAQSIANRQMGSQQQNQQAGKDETANVQNVERNKTSTPKDIIIVPQTQGTPNDLKSKPEQMAAIDEFEQRKLPVLLIDEETYRKHARTPRSSRSAGPSRHRTSPSPTTPYLNAQTVQQSQAATLKSMLRIRLNRPTKYDSDVKAKAFDRIAAAYCSPRQGTSPPLRKEGQDHPKEVCSPPKKEKIMRPSSSKLFCPPPCNSPAFDGHPIQSIKEVDTSEPSQQSTTSLRVDTNETLKKDTTSIDLVPRPSSSQDQNNKTENHEIKSTLKQGTTSLDLVPRPSRSRDQNKKTENHEIKSRAKSSEEILRNKFLKFQKSLTEMKKAKKAKQLETAVCEINSLKPSRSIPSSHQVTLSLDETAEQLDEYLKAQQHTLSTCQSYAALRSQGNNTQGSPKDRIKSAQESKNLGAEAKVSEQVLALNVCGTSPTMSPRFSSSDIRNKERTSEVIKDQKKRIKSPIKTKCLVLREVTTKQDNALGTSRTTSAIIKKGEPLETQKDNHFTPANKMKKHFGSSSAKQIRNKAPHISEDFRDSPSNAKKFGSDNRIKSAKNVKHLGSSSAKQIGDESPHLSDDKLRDSPSKPKNCGSSSAMINQGESPVAPLDLEMYRKSPSNIRKSLLSPSATKNEDGELEPPTDLDLLRKTSNTKPYDYSHSSRVPKDPDNAQNASPNNRGKSPRTSAVKNLTKATTASKISNIKLPARKKEAPRKVFKGRGDKETQLLRRGQVPMNKLPMKTNERAFSSPMMEVNAKPLETPNKNASQTKQPSVPSLKLTKDSTGPKPRQHLTPKLPRKLGHKRKTSPAKPKSKEATKQECEEIKIKVKDLLVFSAQGQSKTSQDSVDVTLPKLNSNQDDPRKKDIKVNKSSSIVNRTTKPIAAVKPMPFKTPEKPAVPMRGTRSNPELKTSQSHSQPDINRGGLLLPDTEALSVLSFTPAFSFSMFDLPVQYRRQSPVRHDVIYLGKGNSRPQRALPKRENRTSPVQIKRHKEKKGVRRKTPKMGAEAKDTPRRKRQQKSAVNTLLRKVEESVSNNKPHTRYPKTFKKIGENLEKMDLVPRKQSHESLSSWGTSAEFVETDDESEDLNIAGEQNNYLKVMDSSRNQQACNQRYWYVQRYAEEANQRRT